MKIPDDNPQGWWNCMCMSVYKHNPGKDLFSVTFSCMNNEEEVGRQEGGKKIGCEWETGRGGHSSHATLSLKPEVVVGQWSWWLKERGIPHTHILFLSLFLLFSLELMVTVNYKCMQDTQSFTIMLLKVKYDCILCMTYILKSIAQYPGKNAAYCLNWARMQGTLLVYVTGHGRMQYVLPCMEGVKPHMLTAFLSARPSMCTTQLNPWPKLCLSVSKPSNNTLSLCGGTESFGLRPSRSHFCSCLQMSNFSTVTVCCINMNINKSQWNRTLLSVLSLPHHHWASLLWLKSWYKVSCSNHILPPCFFFSFYVQPIALVDFLEGTGGRHKPVSGAGKSFL